MVTVKALYERACRELKEMSLDYVFEAQTLCKAVLGLTLSDILLDKEIAEGKCEEAFLSALKKRKSGYPLQYIIGEWDFYGLKFLVGEGVLIPRADTEVLVEAALDYAKDRKDELKILDICSGSGCVAIAIASKLANTRVYAIEKSEKAFEYLVKNIGLNNSSVTPILADAFEYSFNPPMEFDIIVSNPPYLSSTDMTKIEKDVSFEPGDALFGGTDGLNFYRRLTEIWAKKLKPGGLLAYEIGIGQENDVCEILKQNNLNATFFSTDLSGIVRVVGSKILLR